MRVALQIHRDLDCSESDGKNGSEESFFSFSVEETRHRSLLKYDVLLNENLHLMGKIKNQQRTYD